MSNVIVSFGPDINQLNEIKEWLLVEDRKERYAGFYCNWHNSVEYSISRNEIAIVLLDGQPIGFLTWLGDKKVTKIQIAEVKPGFRKRGYGRLLVDAVLNKLQQQGCMVAYLHCQPAKSEKAWKKIGFKQYPNLPDFDNYNDEEQGRHLYRVLVSSTKASTSSKADEVISLWTVERYQADRFSPKWFWKLTFEGDTRKLTTPIIAPVNCNWNMALTINKEIVKSSEIKHFTKGSIEFNGFLIIEDLP
jgi:GNAT superfamily N-acetyltransferase